MSQTIPYAETVGVQGFLKYLHNHYSKLIDYNDTSLISAVAAWFHQESGGLSRVVGNNPFNIRDSPLESGTRKMAGNGHFAIFKTIVIGFEAAALLLMTGGHGAGTVDRDSYGYRLVLNALKHGGGQGAADFLAALAMSSWDSGHYGVHNWSEAYTTSNHLIRNYSSITGVQMAGPTPKKAPPRRDMPMIPRDFNYRVVPRNYLDPYAAAALLRHRRRHA